VINLYLYDVRENHDLRQNQPRIQRNPDGTVTSTRQPTRLDLYYLVTAWSLATTDKVLEEHRLLSQVAFALLRHPYVIPTELFDGVPFPPGYNEALKTARLLAFTAQPDSRETLGYFWGSMENIWKPALNYVVTIPLDLLRSLTGPMVTTKIIGYLQTDKPEAREEWLQIGGRVFDAADPTQGIAGAAVYLQEVDQTAVTDNEGRYTFVRLAAGTYTARARVTGYQSGERTMHVPGPSEEYEFALELATP
jgi:hypothetical protein